MLEEKPLLPIPFNEGLLPVSGGHQLYYAEYGNPKGRAIVLLHGGPGSNCKAKQATSYDLEKTHIIMFDQRGCGQSLPKAELKENTTQYLIEDIETLRQHVGLDSWVVMGNSWGSALALLYAESYPKKVEALILTAVFLGDAEESAAWLYGEDGAARFFPKEFADLKQKLPAAEQVSVIEGYKKRILSDLPKKERQDWAVALLNWEGNLCGMAYNMIADQDEQKQYDALKTPEEKQEAEDAFRDFALTHTTLQLHYEHNAFFIKKEQILGATSKIEHIPTLIVHGRYDTMCPVDGAYQLYQALPQSQLHIVPNAGHSSSEMQETFIAANRKFLVEL